jgi:hypothetical protein
MLNIIEPKSAVEIKDIVLGIGILVTLFLGVWNLVANWRLSRRTAFVNTVTAERVKWLGTLRENISTFCGLTHAWSFSALADKPDAHTTLLQLDKLRHLIRLQLNPDGVHDKEIESLIARIPDLTELPQRVRPEVNTQCDRPMFGAPYCSSFCQN